MKVTCPTCRGPAEWEDNPFRPFCSERCRSADLGNWLNAAYRISAPVEEEDLDEGLPTEGAASPPKDVN
mgnify:CR=1 FL=1